MLCRVSQLRRLLLYFLYNWRYAKNFEKKSCLNFYKASPKITMVIPEVDTNFVILNGAPYILLHFEFFIEN